MQRKNTEVAKDIEFLTKIIREVPRSKPLFEAYLTDISSQTHPTHTHSNEKKANEIEIQENSLSETPEAIEIEDNTSLQNDYEIIDRTVASTNTLSLNIAPEIIKQQLKKLKAVNRLRMIVSNVQDQLKPRPYEKNYICNNLDYIKLVEKRFDYAELLSNLEQELYSVGLITTLVEDIRILCTHIVKSLHNAEHDQSLTEGELIEIANDLLKRTDELCSAIDQQYLNSIGVTVEKITPTQLPVYVDAYFLEFCRETINCIKNNDYNSLLQLACELGSHFDKKKTGKSIQITEEHLLHLLKENKLQPVNNWKQAHLLLFFRKAASYINNNSWNELVDHILSTPEITSIVNRTNPFEENDEKKPASGLQQHSIYSTYTVIGNKNNNLDDDLMRSISLCSSNLDLR